MFSVIYMLKLQILNMKHLGFIYVQFTRTEIQTGTNTCNYINGFYYARIWQNVHNPRIHGSDIFIVLKFSLWRECKFRFPPPCQERATHRHTEISSLWFLKPTNQSFQKKLTGLAKHSTSALFVLIDVQ